MQEELDEPKFVAKEVLSENVFSPSMEESLQFKAAAASTKADQELASKTLMIASFKKRKKLTIEQQQYLVEQKIHCHRSSMAIKHETGISVSIINKLAKACADNPNWLTEKEASKKQLKADE